MKQIFALLVFGILLFGCVSQGTYDELKANYTSVAAERDALKAQLSSVKTTVQKLAKYQDYLQAQVTNDTNINVSKAAATKVSPEFEAAFNNAVASAESMTTYLYDMPSQTATCEEWLTWSGEAMTLTGDLMTEYGNMDKVLFGAMLKDISAAVNATK